MDEGLTVKERICFVSKKYTHPYTHTHTHRHTHDSVSLFLIVTETKFNSLLLWLYQCSLIEYEPILCIIRFSII